MALAGEAEGPRGTGVGLVEVVGRHDPVHVALIGIGAVVPPVGKGEGVAEFVVQDALRGPVAHPGEASGLSAGIHPVDGLQQVGYT